MKPRPSSRHDVGGLALQTREVHKVWVVPGFHSDAVWIEDQRDYAIILQGNVEQNLMLCAADASYGCFLHELTYLKPYYDTHVHHRELIKELITAGRIGTGGSHSQPSETIIGPESIVRNIIYGRLFHEGVLGDRPTVYMGWDVFGHCSQLSQILAKARFKGCIWSKEIRGCEPVFWHLAPDGSRLLFKRMHYAMPGSGIEEEFLRIIDERAQELASFGLTADMRLDAGDFKPPTIWWLGRCAELADRTPGIIISGKGHEDWFDYVLEETRCKPTTIPVTARDFEWHHQGTGLSRIDLKIANRLSEEALFQAEMLATFSSYLGARYPDRALDKAWRQAVFNQHHDAITGTSNDRSYVDLLLGSEEALELATEVRDNALDFIGTMVNTTKAPADRNATPIMVFNSSNWQRDDVCRVQVQFDSPAAGLTIRDDQGRPVPCDILNARDHRDGVSFDVLFVARQVPPMGYVLLYATPSPFPTSTLTKKDGLTIENEFLRVIVDQELGGGMISLYDKMAKRELLPNAESGRALGNEIVILKQDPGRREPSWEVYTTGVSCLARESKTSVQVHEGTVVSKLVIQGTLQQGGRYQEIILYKGVRRVEFITRIEGYAGQDEVHLVTFPSTLQGLQPVFEDRFATTVKRKSKGYLDFRTSQWRNDSNCGARHGYRWFGLGQSGSVQCGEPSEAEHTALSLGMVGLITAHNPLAEEQARRLQEALIGLGIPVTPLYDDLDTARRKSLPVEDARTPVSDLNEDLPWGTSFRLALDISGDNRYFSRVFGQLSPHKQEHYKMELASHGHCSLLALDRDMPDGWPALPVVLIGATNPMGLKEAVSRLCADLASGTIRLPAVANATAGREQIDSYGIEVFNLGHGLGSVEHDNTLVLFLMQTAAWGGFKWGRAHFPFIFVPEWKTHQYCYALHPHEGDWRSANVVQAAQDYNSPLLARQIGTHEGHLPPRMSFLSLDGESVVVTAVKPSGFGAAALSNRSVEVSAVNEYSGDHTKAPYQISGGIVVRAYEAHGVRTDSRLRFYRPLIKASLTNLLEESLANLAIEDRSAPVLFRPWSIETIHFVPAKEGAVDHNSLRTLGREAEAAQPIHVRYWQHNVGADPLGYSPVGVLLDGRVQTAVHTRQGGVTANTLTVQVWNDYIDRTVDGEVRILTPPTWKAHPNVIPYHIPPGGHLSRDVVLGFVTDRETMYKVQPKKGLVKARLIHDGQMYQDVMEIGGESHLEWHAFYCPEQAAVLVDICNHNLDEITGEVFLARPMELWGRSLAGNMSLGCLSPRSRPFRIHGGSQKTLCFGLSSGALRLCEKPGETWILAKLTYHGHVSYRQVLGLSACTGETERQSLLTD